MTSNARHYTLEISEPLFRLTTESLRLRSNETYTHESLASLTLFLASRNRDLTTHDTDVLRQHLKVIPGTGDIRVQIALPPPCMGRIEALKTDLAPRIGHPLTSEEMLSLLLFDYVVEQKAAHILETIGFGRSGAPDHLTNEAPFSH